MSEVINDKFNETKFDPEQLPNKVKMRYTLTYNIGGYDAGQISLSGWHKSYCSEDEVILTHGVIEVEIPPIDGKGIKTKAVETLEACKKEMQAKHFKEMQELQNKIDSLLAIEYKPNGGCYEVLEHIIW